MFICTLFFISRIRCESFSVSRLDTLFNERIQPFEGIYIRNCSTTPLDCPSPQCECNLLNYVPSYCNDAASALNAA